MSTYLEAVKDVGAMISDPDVIRYKTRIQEHLKRAMSELLKSELFSEADYPDSEKLKTDLSFATNPYNAAILSFVRLINIYPSPLVASDVRVAMKSPNQIAAAGYNAEMKPAYDEIFINQINTLLTAVVASPSAFTIGSDTLYMKYVADVDDEGWVDTTEFSNRPTAQTSGTLTIGEKCIITTFVSGDNFSNMGTSEEITGNGATGDSFYALATTPTTWTNSSTVTPLYMFSKSFIRAAVMRAVETIRATDLAGE